MKNFKIWGILLAALIFNTNTYAQIKLPQLISDGMVLQRDAEVKVWGWASPKEEVKVAFLGKSYSSTTDQNGKWSIKIDRLKPGGPYEMDIVASNQIKLQNILIGDVWVCSGQSNMELTMGRVAPLYPGEIAAAKNSNIRYFHVPNIYDFNHPHDDLTDGKWKEVCTEHIRDFSALAFFFADELYNKYKIPIGLINSSLGGSPVEAWLSEDALKSFPSYYEEAQKFKDNALITKIEEEDNTISHNWYTALQQTDMGYKDPKGEWSEAEYNDSDWATMDIPGYWADTELGNVNGVVWFRKELDVPASMAEKATDLQLGRIVDSDSVFLNGTFVGTTGYQYPPRRYQVPAKLLKEGKNTLVIRIINNSGKGGFVEDKPYYLAADMDTLSLEGTWRYRLGAAMEPLPGPTFIRWKPMGLYNGMIAPLIDYTMKGVIWYQGESNTGRAEEYQELFTSMINNWRDKWQQGDFPFLYVQLANYMKTSDQPGESQWADLREAQLKALSVPNTAMAVTIDLGEWNDIHPLNKKDVGKRLALAAQKMAYGEEELVYSGPIYKSNIIYGNKVILEFTQKGSGLMVKDGNKLKEFAIAGADGKFVWANAKIENDKVVVWSDQVENPLAVRYAWADNPEEANLFNKEGLPASPFRTDE